MTTLRDPEHHAGHHTGTDADAGPAAGSAASAALEPVRTLDMASMKALAHPLRVQILEALANYGAQTACGLGELLNESSGATSYHLRQLAKYDFVHEVPGRGTARERWWERASGPIEVGSRELATSPVVGDATRLVTREIERSRAAALAEFATCGYERLPEEWQDAGTLSTSHARLTAEQLAEFSRQMDEFSRVLLERLKAAGPQPGARPVQIHFNAFPLVSDEAERAIARGAAAAEKANAQSTARQTTGNQTTGKQTVDSHADNNHSAGNHSKGNQQ
ncbi:ArsR/SmtB family transcription factor [Arthrobacter sp. 35W]|uniref:ArsR/SmtB family transcription factor n=1 Tax=Arthrobacter sp. 35W TaxID=1132441 RepID=UPI000403EC58|nr:winged helix-turn-helix domain-containing protein [Arthrobacter sp. 35W]